MKKNIFLLAAFIFSFLISCNNSEKKTDPLQAQADSLQKEVLAGHDIAMPKSRKIPALQKQIQQMIDSISNLSPKGVPVNASYKMELENLFNNLSSADSTMNKWMDEFNLDYFNTNVEQRIKYLSGEKIKIDKVKEAVLNSLQMADSLLKKKKLSFYSKLFQMMQSMFM